MIERKDILSIPYLKKTSFTGSYEGMRFRFRMAEGDPDPQLEVMAWEGPYACDFTPEEKKQVREVSFDEKGIQEGIAWLNGLWEADPKRWKRAKENW